MKALRAEVLAEDGAAGLRVIKPAHFLGFLDPSAWQVPVSRKRRSSTAFLEG